MTATGVDPAFAAALGALTVRLGLGEMSALRRMSGGASLETWAFSAGGQDFVLRRGYSTGGAAHQAVGPEVEAKLMQLAYAQGVPSPRVRYVLTPEDGLGHGFMMEFVPGETLGGRIVKSPAFDAIRPKLAYQCGQVLARLHSIPLDQCPPLPLRGPPEALGALKEMYRKENLPRPVFELGFRWLEDRLPDSSRLTLAHGDFRNGNLIFGEDGVRAVLDWEIPVHGDPMQDLGWLCTASWRFGGDKPVGGFGLREDLFAGYEAESGIKIDPARVRFWEMLGSLRWGVMCTRSRQRYINGDHAVDRPMIARRISETELDLVNLMTGV